MLEFASCLLIHKILAGQAWCSADPVSQDQANVAVSRILPFVQLYLRCDQVFGIGTNFCARKQRAISRADLMICSCRKSHDRGLLHDDKVKQNSHGL